MALLKNGKMEGVVSKSKQLQGDEVSVDKPKIEVVGVTSISFSITRDGGRTIEGLRFDDINLYLELAKKYLVPSKVVEIFRGLWSNLSEQLKVIYLNRYQLTKFPC